jgi:hypothetical protein
MNDSSLMNASVMIIQELMMMMVMMMLTRKKILSFSSLCFFPLALSSLH